MGARETYDPWLHAGATDPYQDFPDAWDDLPFPASAINPAGTVAPPTLDDSLDGITGTLLFSGSAENAIAVPVQMTHAWKEGSIVRPHIHWSKPVGSASTTSWVMYYRHLGNPGDVAGAWVGPVAGTVMVGDPAVTDEHTITAFGNVDMTGFRASCMTVYRIHRLGNTDADNGTARLYQFDVHYQKSRDGTYGEYVDG